MPSPIFIPMAGGVFSGEIFDKLFNDVSDGKAAIAGSPYLRTTSLAIH